MSGFGLDYLPSASSSSVPDTNSWHQGAPTSSWAAQDMPMEDSSTVLLDSFKVAGDVLFNILVLYNFILSVFVLTCSCATTCILLFFLQSPHSLSFSPLCAVNLVELYDAAWSVCSGAAPDAAETEAAARPRQHEPATLRVHG